jgi:hypothetical protein
MLTDPVGKVLESARARLYQHRAEDQTGIREKDIADQVLSKVTVFRNKFKETYLSVLQGMNKNIFPEVENTLKEKLWDEMAAIGVDDPTPVIEAAFTAAAEPFLENVFDKTLELLDKPDEVREEIISMVNKAAYGVVASKEDASGSRELIEKLTKGSVPLSIGDTTKDVKGDMRSKLKLAKVHRLTG